MLLPWTTSTTPVGSNPAVRVWMRRGRGGGAGMDVRPERNQHLHDAGMLLGHGPHQRRLPPRELPGVHVRPVGREEAHPPPRTRCGRPSSAPFRPTAARRSHRRPPPAGFLDHRLAAVDAAQPERRGAELVRRADVRAGPNERFRHRPRRPSGRPSGGRSRRPPAGHSPGHPVRAARSPASSPAARAASSSPRVLGGGGAGHGQQQRHQEHRPSQPSRMHALRPPEVRRDPTDPR